MWAFKNLENENIMYEVIYEFKNIFKKLKLFKMIFEAEMPLFFLIKYRKIKKKGSVNSLIAILCNIQFILLIYYTIKKI